MNRRNASIAIAALLVLLLCGAVWARMTVVVVGQLASVADVTAPTCSTATIGTNGTALTLAMSETVTRSGGTFDVDCSTAGANITATYSSGSGSNSLVYTLGTTVNSGDTCNLDYNGAANGIEDAAGNDLASITDKAITNNSTQSASSYEIEDHFASDTTANYTQTGGDSVVTISVSGGKLHATTAYKYSWWQHNTALSSANHYAQAKIMLGTSYSDYTALFARASDTVGHMNHYTVRFGGEGDNTYITLYRVVENSETYLDWYAINAVANQEYDVKLSVNGTGATVTVTVNIDGTDRITYNDTNAARLTSGTHIGIGFKQSNDNRDVTVDDLLGDAL